jgi:hypothetical protein
MFHSNIRKIKLKLYVERWFIHIVSQYNALEHADVLESWIVFRFMLHFDIEVHACSGCYWGLNPGKIFKDKRFTCSKSKPSSIDGATKLSQAGV